MRSSGQHPQQMKIMLTCKCLDLHVKWEQQQKFATLGRTWSVTIESVTCGYLVRKRVRCRLPFEVALLERIADLFLVVLLQTCWTRMSKAGTWMQSAAHPSLGSFISFHNQLSLKHFCLDMLKLRRSEQMPHFQEALCARPQGLQQVRATAKSLFEA